MKRLKVKYFFPLIALGFTGFLSVTAPLQAVEDTKVPEALAREVLETVNSSVELNKEIKNVGKSLVNCPGCAPKGPDLTAILNGEEVDIGNPYYRKADDPYVIYLKRTSKSPGTVNLKFKNGYEYCARMYGGSIGGSIYMGCVLNMTRYEVEEISLNLKKLPKLEEGQEEVIELRFSKPNVKNSKYELKVKSLSDSSYKEDVSKKFFGGGFNVSFKVEKE